MYCCTVNLSFRVAPNAMAAGFKAYYHTECTEHAIEHVVNVLYFIITISIIIIIIILIIIRCCENV